MQRTAANRITKLDAGAGLCLHIGRHWLRAGGRGASALSGRDVCSSDLDMLRNDECRGRQQTELLNWTPGRDSVCISAVTGSARVRAGLSHEDSRPISGKTTETLKL